MSVAAMGLRTYPGKIIIITVVGAKYNGLRVAQDFFTQSVLTLTCLHTDI